MSKQSATVALSKETPKRLTREQSKAQTRERLLEVGRRHILQHGIGDCIAERIAEEAGYSRGAFYGNFDDKDDLLIAVILQYEESRAAVFQDIDRQVHTGADMLVLVRSAFADRITDPEWIVLQAEFEAGALRSEKIRQAYMDVHRNLLRQGRDTLNTLARIPGVHLSMKPNDLLLTMLSLAQGLAVNQRLLGTELRTRSVRQLIHSVFDQLVTLDKA
jgi:AcrR family transcriptional regulator